MSRTASAPAEVEPVRRFHLRRRKARMQPPLTPMIDIVFQLLLFFLLTMEFRRAEGMLPAHLPAPQTSVAAVTPLEPLEVRLTRERDGTLRIAMDALDFHASEWSRLGAMLTEVRLRLDAAETPVLIVPGPGVDWQDALNAFNQARNAGMEKIDFRNTDLIGQDD
jgi:biopolymer transport protein ExbD